MKVVSLCTGYGGLELALTAAGIEHELAYVADPDPAAAKVLAARFPGVPNLGDIAAVDWTATAVGGGPLIVTAGFPCTDVSLAGLGAGIAEGTRSGVWLEVARAVAELGPDLVLIENVRGLLSARAHSDVEPCPWCLGDRGGPDQEPALRALGAVLGDLSDLRYDSEWITVAASDVGACHQRERVFITAHPADAPCLGHGYRREGSGQRLPAEVVAGALLPTPRTSDTNGAGHHGDGGLDLRTAVANLLLPTPTAVDGNRATAHYPNQYTTLPDAIATLLPTPTAANGHGNTHNNRGDLLLPGAVRLLPTPNTGLTPNGHGRRGGRSGNGRQSGADLDAMARAEDPTLWGQYAPAIARWEAIVGRPAPEPTEPGKTGPRLAPRFVEWLMGLPEGWVCDVPGLSRNDMLRLLGNGVVYQQAAHALRRLEGAP